MNVQDSYFDNLKFILVLLVVFAHFYAINIWSALVDGLANFSYSFHAAGWFLYLIFIRESNFSKFVKNTVNVFHNI
jgi:hypothetical protein